MCHNFRKLQNDAFMMNLFTIKLCRENGQTLGQSGVCSAVCSVVYNGACSLQCTIEWSVQFSVTNSNHHQRSYGVITHCSSSKTLYNLVNPRKREIFTVCFLLNQPLNEFSQYVAMSVCLLCVCCLMAIHLNKGQASRGFNINTVLTNINCRSPDFKSPIDPTKNLERLYNQVVVCLFGRSFATLVITASSNSKCCPADQTRPDQTK